MFDGPLLLDLPLALQSFSSLTHVLDQIFAVHLEGLLLLDGSQLGFGRLMHSFGVLRGFGPRNGHIDGLHCTILVVL